MREQGRLELVVTDSVGHRGRGDDGDEENAERLRRGARRRRRRRRRRRARRDDLRDRFRARIHAVRRWARPGRDIVRCHRWRSSRVRNGWELHWGRRVVLSVGIKARTVSPVRVCSTTPRFCGRIRVALRVQCHALPDGDEAARRVGTVASEREGCLHLHVIVVHARRR